MFLFSPQHLGLDAPIYEMDGHEFVPCPFISADSYACRLCGQTSTAEQLGGAIAGGYAGVFTECQAKKEAALKAKDCCLFCERELSRSYLDLYLGFDPVDKDLCRDCRTKRAKTNFELLGEV
ncbi:MAG: hypothetical protein ACT4TC_16970 [Myxococcaceae bacterium]